MSSFASRERRRFTPEEYLALERGASYQTIDSLQEYILVSQDQPWVEPWSRRRDDQWLVSSFKKMSVELNLASIDCSPRLDEIYERVEFSS